MQHGDNFPNCSSIVDNLQEWQYDSIDQSTFQYQAGVDANSNESLCLSQLYCNSTDTLEASCDDYWFNHERLSVGFCISFLFLSFVGLAPYITLDIQETMVEEAVLNCLLDTSSPSLHRAKCVGAQIIYFSLRGRHLILPFFIAQATASIFLSNDFSVINMLLNILSITFLVEIDNILWKE